MSTKNVTTSQQSGVFAPAGMANYNQFQGAGGNALMQYMSDPMQSTFFNQRVAMGNQNLFNLFNRNNQNIMNRASLFGGNQMPGFLQNQLTQSGYQLSGAQAQNFNQNLFYADQARQNAMYQGLNYRPLQTGSTGTQTQQTSGLGTWLPQVAGMGLSALTMGMGGMPGMGGGGGAASFGGNVFRSIADSGAPIQTTGMDTGGLQPSAPVFLPQIPNNQGWS